MASSSLQFPTRSYHPLQCPTCKDLLRNPVTLPCGFTVCQACLPPTQTIASQQQIKCPFRACSRSTLHRPDQLPIDITLQNLTTALRTVALQSNILEEDSENAKPHRQPDTLFYGNASADPAWGATLEGLYDPYDTVSVTVTATATGPAAVATSSPSQSTTPITSQSTSLSRATRHHSIPSSIFYRHLPAILDTVRSKIQQDIECQVCFLVFDHPITAYCGHTLCKSCFITSLDHKPSCPLCRHGLPRYMHYHNQPPNKALVRFLQYLATTLPNTTTAINDIWDVPREERAVAPTLAMTPLFITMLVFPKMPCFLMVFEPRYRKMLRNVLQTQSQLFGMVLPPQSNKGWDPDNTAWEPSMEYGTLLKIISCELLVDGRALVETVGVGRFQILTYSTMDGYFAATAVELIHDMPAEQELALERDALEAAARAAAAAQEDTQYAGAESSGSSIGKSRKRTDSDHRNGLQRKQTQDNQGRSRSAATAAAAAAVTPSSNSLRSRRRHSSFSSRDFSLDSPSSSSSTQLTSSNALSIRNNEEATQTEPCDLLEMNLEALSRKQLMEILMSFVIQMQERLGALAAQRLQREYGEIIDDDGQYFSFWVASIIPVSSYQKYELLRETSVRRRLLAVLGWIRDMETRRVPVTCTIS